MASPHCAFEGDVCFQGVMSMRLLARCLAAALCLAASVAGSQAQPAGSQIPVVTRLVRIFLDYEQRLFDAVSRRDADAIGRLLADDFEMRVASRPGQPIPRADWIAQRLNEPAAATVISQMAVRDYGDVQIVSFLASAALNGGRQRDLMVVDVWKLSGDDAVLKARYEGAGAAQSGGAPAKRRAK
jgi:hypothetical protein